MENFGPIPPKVGEETSYAIHWKISNVSNDISDVKVSAYLPTWARWNNKVFPQEENVSFNERTHEIIWDIGKMKNGTGVLDDPREVVFQISVLPEVNQIKENIPIMTNTILTARDDFTGSNIREEIKQKTTSISEDISIAANGYSVVE